MLYMFLLLPGVRSAPVRMGAMGAMAAMAASPARSRFSVLALAMALFLLGYAVRLGDRLTIPVAPADAGVPAPALAPRCAVLCKIAMGYMLILML
jgi:hypothetical protein